MTAINLHEETGLSSLARGLVGSDILKVAAEIRALTEKGREICNLTVGDFSPKEFPIPKKLAQLIEDALRAGETNYPPADGVKGQGGDVLLLRREPLPTLSARAGLADDAVRPRGQGIARLDRGSLAGQNQERSLKGILGVMGIAQDPPAYLKDHGTMPLDQRGEGPLIPLCTRTVQESCISYLVRFK